MCKKCNYVFGVDRSFSALQEAKKPGKKNMIMLLLTHFPIFGKLNFELVVGSKCFRNNGTNNTSQNNLPANF